jgi:hypothetical protein
VGRRSRRREKAGAPGRPEAPVTEYAGEDGAVLALRGVLTPATRTEYAAIASGEALAPGAAREDAYHRAGEFLFERLAASWTIAGAPALTRPKELLARYRAASRPEREWIRGALREHCAEHFPDVHVP